ncbi:MAG: S8 family serine peptidase [Planctomycetota bacterium]
MTRRIHLNICLAMLVFLLGTVCATAAERIFVDADVTGPKIRQDYVPNEIIVKLKNNVPITLEEKISIGSGVAHMELSASLDKLNKRFCLSNVKPVFKNFKTHRRRLKALLKKDKTLLTKREKRILQRLKQAGERAAVPALDRIYKLQLDLEPDQSIQQVLAAYNNDPSVEYAELNYIVSICKTPDDSLYSLQWPLNNTGQDYPESGYYNPPPGTPDCDIDAPEAWDIHTGSSKVIVAVVDSGVDYKHRDLQDSIWVNQTELNGADDVDDDDNGYIDDIYGYDFINNDSDPFDDLGHGTHCSGTIAARGNNGLDIVGVCWNAKIMALKFLDAEGAGYTSDAATAFYYAVANGADVISNSWGGDDYSETLEEAINYAHSQGVIMVAAAGNSYSDSPHYPAYYEHMIAVAATNSNDAKPSFSNYGDWVDIAAPGVDILSLRASGTSRGTPYDSHTTVATGTSMACPHVAGACALLLSFNATLTSDDVNDILMETGDPISPGICISDSRLNLLNAMIAAVPSRGYISLEHDVYSCSSAVSILLLDCDLKEQGSQEVTLTIDGGDSETVLLTEGAPAIGVFTGTIQTGSGATNIEDGTLQLFHGEVITVTYQDQDDGTGNPAAATDTALADCESPEIFNVQIDVPGPEPTVTFETDEPATTRVWCGLACGGSYIIEGSNEFLATSHTIKLIGVSPKTDYFFIIEAIDTAGNETLNDNAGACFAFTTDEGPRDIFVPSQYSTIQEAIYRSWNGGTVRVADGTYTGQGNRDIDLLGRAITVRSENGPESCIIDCNGTQDEPHRGFYIHSAEDSNSVIDGFTITNGYAPKGFGGGIYCRDSSPTVKNCTLSNNSAELGGGGMRNYNSSPTITNCTFSGNSADFGSGMYNSSGGSPMLTNCTFSANTASGTYGQGGGMANQATSPTLIDCTFSDNTTSGGGSGMYNKICDHTYPKLNNCIFSGNLAVYHHGGGMRNYISSPTLTNCTFSGNSTARNGGGMYNYYDSSPTLTNCIFSGNTTAENGGGMYNLRNSHPILINCTFIGNSAALNGGGMNNINNSKPKLTNCTFSGNLASNGGGMNNERGRPILTNCTFAANSAPNGNALACDSWHQLSPSKLRLSNCILWDGENGIWNNDNSTITITYSNIQHGWPGGGNIDADPLFVDAGYWADTNDQNIPAEPNDPNAVWIDGDYHLLPDSPCINAGDPNHPLDPNETDIDGQPRIIGGRVDMGSDEFHGNNVPPVADAGADQIVYAWFNGIAEVTLHGTASNDDDSHPLTYNWSWTIDGQTCTATGPDPTIELPVGKQTIELIVNDRVEDSEPGHVVITVIEPVESQLWIVPRAINRHSSQPKIFTLLRLPEGINSAQIDSDQPLLLYPAGIEAIRQHIIRSSRGGAQQVSIFAFFDKSELMNVVGDNGEVELQVVGRLKITGQYFYGTDTVTIISSHNDGDDD